MGKRYDENYRNNVLRDFDSYVAGGMSKIKAAATVGHVPAVIKFWRGKQEASHPKVKVIDMDTAAPIRGRPKKYKTKTNPIILTPKTSTFRPVILVQDEASLELAQRIYGS